MMGADWADGAGVTWILCVQASRTRNTQLQKKLSARRLRCRRGRCSRWRGGRLPRRRVLGLQERKLRQPPLLRLKPVAHNPAPAFCVSLYL